jgi:ABC-2 type transport system permease protein
MPRAAVTTAAISLQQYLLHRSFWVGLFIGRVLPILIPLFAWTAVFASAGQKSLGDWTETKMISYYLLVFIFSMFTQIYFHRDLSRMVHDGTLNHWLLRPLSFFEMAVGMILGRVLTLLIPAVIVCIIGSVMIPELRELLWPYGMLKMAVLLPGVIFLLSCLSALIGMFSFWLIQTEGTFAMMMMVFEFFGGTLLPLSLLPSPLQHISTFLPLRFTINLPVRAILEHGSINIFYVIAGQALWSCGLIFAATILCKAGLRRYDAIGG